MVMNYDSQTHFILIREWDFIQKRTSFSLNKCNGTHCTAKSMNSAMSSTYHSGVAAKASAYGPMPASAASSCMVSSEQTDE